MLSDFVKEENYLLKLLALRRKLITGGEILRYGFYICIAMVLFVFVCSKIVDRSSYIQHDLIFRIGEWTLIGLFNLLAFIVQQKRKQLKKDYCNVQLKIDIILLSNLCKLDSVDFLNLVDEERIEAMLLETCVTVDKTLIQDVEADFFRGVTDFRFLDERIKKSTCQVCKSKYLMCVFVICVIPLFIFMDVNSVEGCLSALSAYWAMIRWQYFTVIGFVNINMALESMKYNFLIMGRSENERKYKISRSLIDYYNNSSEEVVMTQGVLLKSDKKVEFF